MPNSLSACIIAVGFLSRAAGGGKKTSHICSCYTYILIAIQLFKFTTPNFDVYC